MTRIGEKTKIAFIVLFIAVTVLSPYFANVGFAFADGDLPADVAYLREVRDGIVNWKKSDLGSSAGGYLICDNLLALAGTTPGDWYPFGLSRGGISDNQGGYLAVINDEISKRYATPQKLDRVKATEWQRIALAMLACGGDPRHAGNDGDIDLIADGTYSRVDDNGNGILQKQGINGVIWGLICLDSGCYSVTDDAFYSRDDIILSLLAYELPSGGWALYGDVADPDITAMCVTALAPYYNSEKQYRTEGNQSAGGRKVRQAVDKALDVLSAQQSEDGDYFSWGTQNCESTVWVAIALCSLGRDPGKEADFIKNGKTLVDGIMKYRNSDGGFLHSYTYDEENPSSLPDKSNTMASEQTLYGIVALMRQRLGMRRLFDIRPEMTAEQKMAVQDVTTTIDGLSFDSNVGEISDTYAKYLSIDALNRSYVSNYRKLSQIMTFAGVPFAEETFDYKSGEVTVDDAVREFTEVDMKAVDELPLQEKLTLKNRAEVLRLWSKINNCFDFERKNYYTARLELAKKRIDDIMAEVESLAADIKEKLYPFDNITLADKDAVYALYARYSALSDYDKTLLEETDVEGLIRAKTQVDNLTVAVWVSVASVVVIAVLTTFVVLHVRARRKKRAEEKMPESEE